MAGIRAMECLLSRGVIARPGSSAFIDVGANIGIYTTVLAKYFATVLAFEPHPITSRLLELNVEINKVKNVRMFRCALSDREGKAQLADAGVDNVGASTLEVDRLPQSLRDGTVHEVDVHCGDAFLDAERLTAPLSFVKIDVEGHEGAVIDGMIKLLQEQKPVVAFEANTGGRSEQVRQRLEQIGYSAFLALDFYPRVRPLLLRIFFLTFFGVRHALKPVDSLSKRSYSLVFALTDAQKRRLDNQ